jgi:hypothetical protein
MCVPVPLIDCSDNSCDPDPVLHEHMIEINRLHDAGVKSGAIKEDGVMVGVPQGWWLVAAPPRMDSPAHSLIFWEPAPDDNHTPSIAKVVCDLCSR